MCHLGHVFVVVGHHLVRCFGTIKANILPQKGCGFESRCHILDGHFLTLIFCKNCIVCLKRPIINEKEAWVGPFKKHFTTEAIAC